MVSNKNVTRMIVFSFFALLGAFLSVNAFAGEPTPWQLGFQESASPVKQELQSFHNLLLYIITAIVIVVFCLLAYVMIRFNARVNPKPSNFSHNTVIEVIWTVVPICILIVIAIPSFKVLFYMDKVADPDMTLKVTGYQWGWTYTYPDHGDIEFNADIIREADEMEEFFPNGEGRRLLETYNPVVLPINQNIEILVTSRPEDVIHSWAVPSFGVKTDAVPGRMNHTWTKITKPGVYFGQCSEICGRDHAYMPISIYAVTESEFAQWVECVQNEDTDSFYVARGCAQNLNLDKYRQPHKRIKTIQFANVESN